MKLSQSFAFPLFVTRRVDEFEVVFSEQPIKRLVTLKVVLGEIMESTRLSILESSIWSSKEAEVIVCFVHLHLVLQILFWKLCYQTW